MWLRTFVDFMSKETEQKSFILFQRSYDVTEWDFANPSLLHCTSHIRSDPILYHFSLLAFSFHFSSASVNHCVNLRIINTRCSLVPLSISPILAQRLSFLFIAGYAFTWSSMRYCLRIAPEPIQPKIQHRLMTRFASTPEATIHTCEMWVCFHSSFITHSFHRRAKDSQSVQSA